MIVPKYVTVKLSCTKNPCNYRIYSDSYCTWPKALEDLENRVWVQDNHLNTFWRSNIQHCDYYSQQYCIIYSGCCTRVWTAGSTYIKRFSTNLQLVEFKNVEPWIQSHCNIIDRFSTTENWNPSPQNCSWVNCTSELLRDWIVNILTTKWNDNYVTWWRL